MRFRIQIHILVVMLAIPFNFSPPCISSYITFQFNSKLSQLVLRTLRINDSNLTYVLSRMSQMMGGAGGMGGGAPGAPGVPGAPGGPPASMESLLQVIIKT